MSEQRPLRDRVLELAVFAPAGLVRRLRDELPTLIETGRREVVDRVRVAHWVGEMAVGYGRAELRRLRTDAETAGSAVADVGDAARPPFDGYDELPAERLVELLGTLPASQLATIRMYEQAQRKRRTVLAKIDQLIDS